jgi:cholesterol oxidase
MNAPLSSNWYSRSEAYDVIIIGSGYGGAIAARRIAEEDFDNKPSVCMLERGMEWIPGLFPDEIEDVASHFLTPLNPLGLYEFRANKNISVIQGSGLGGTSLVNANVAIVPEPEVFEQKSWPQDITGEMLSPYFENAATGLDLAKHPEGMNLAKVQALEKRAGQLQNANSELLRLAVNFKVDGTDPETGVERHPCTDCGDCVTGCNVLAKNTLYMNYLPLARKAGAEIFTRVRVSHIQINPDGGYFVHYERFSPRHNLPETGIIRANRAVVVSAGSLGTTEIMLRSREQGLNLPDTVGSRFSGNGDFFGIAYNSDQRTDIMGFGNNPNEPPRSDVKAGPTIVGAIRYDRDKPLHEQITVEDLTVPRAAVDLARKTLGILAAKGEDTDPGVRDRIRELARIARDSQIDVGGAINHSMVYLVMGHDDAEGILNLKKNKLQIEWPEVGKQEVFERINKELFQHAKAIGATFIGNPVWELLNARQLVTAHPLGGCPMGDTSSTGMVDSKGNVFSGYGEKDTHPGLFVADGSNIPSAVGVNPFFTISALSEHIAKCIINELK